MLRLLIVDDEQIIREALSQMIDYQTIGYELIGTARNGMEAYDIICDEYPDVVITDIRMPILDGLALIEKARKTDIHIAFIVLSGYSEFEYAKQAMKYGVKNYLLKPTMREELLDALTDIQNDFAHEEKRRQETKEQHLEHLKLPLEQCFVMEGVEHFTDFERIYKKYKNLRIFDKENPTVCYCYFVEENYLNVFIKYMYHALKLLKISCAFPIIYVKNTVIILAQMESLSCREAVKQAILKKSFKKQKTPFEIKFEHYDSDMLTYQNVLRKISRFERILLFSEGSMEPYEISNTLISPGKIRLLYEQLGNAASADTFDAFFNELISENTDVEHLRPLVLNLFLLLNSEDAASSPCTGDIIQKIYTCTTMDRLKELLRATLSKKSDMISPKPNNVALIKQYVNSHLDSENLSLKWLAENYLYVNVDYLSKQFNKEEGIRFSEFLNKKRMEQAAVLLAYYKSDNIKDVAKQVGFGSNPQYFSQVFKKYTGSTPSEYLDSIQQV